MMDTGHVIHTFTLSSQPRNFGRHAALHDVLNGYRVPGTELAGGCQQARFVSEITQRKSTFTLLNVVRGELRRPRGEGLEKFHTAVNPKSIPLGGPRPSSSPNSACPTIDSE